MADHIDGPLYYERMGRTGPVMAFVHLNPMDQSCWIFQMAHMSTWFRCIAIDIPGYGRSPKARDGLTMSDMAEGCWEAIETEFPEEPAILVGCSVGSAILPYMHHTRPSKTKALVMCGTGYNPGKEFTGHRIKQPMGLHLRGLEPGLSPDAAGDVLRRHVRRAQCASRSRDDRPPISSPEGARRFGSLYQREMPLHHSKRQ
jgi:pimeloyl-ACP methyl ester carboxylesterase